MVSKSQLQTVRDEQLLEAWAAGDMARGFPAVILTDLKTRYTEQYPFSMFYNELHRRARQRPLVVVGGYSFGDRPLNRALAHFLSRDPENRLIVWNPTGTRDCTSSGSASSCWTTSGRSRRQISVEEVRCPMPRRCAACRLVASPATDGAARPLFRRMRRNGRPGTQRGTEHRGEQTIRDNSRLSHVCRQGFAGRMLPQMIIRRSENVYWRLGAMVKCKLRR